MEKLSHRRIFIAGATGGIGSQTARLLAGSGARLFLAGRNLGKLEKLGRELNLTPDAVFEMDVSDEARVNQVAASLHAAEGSMDIVINASGVGIIKPLEQLSLQDFNHSLQTNLTGAFLLAKAFLPPMKQVGKGLFINIPGVLGKVPMAGAAAYSASKYGLVGMMQSLREELKRTQVRITNIYLGGVDSPFWDEIDLRVQKEKMIRSDEAARAIWFLCQQPESGVVSEMVLQPFNHQAI
jgi:NADP-dependent 3-hydroxy acid dehydrogenase YdfG